MLLRLPGARPGPSSIVGNPRSLSAGPPSDSYFCRIAPCMKRAPVAGVKNMVPEAKFCANPSPAGYTSPVLGPSGPVSPPPACHAAVIASLASTSGCAAAAGANRSAVATPSSPIAKRPANRRRSIGCRLILPPRGRRLVLLQACKILRKLPRAFTVRQQTSITKSPRRIPPKNMRRRCGTTPPHPTLTLPGCAR